MTRSHRLWQAPFDDRRTLPVYQLDENIPQDQQRLTHSQDISYGSYTQCVPHIASLERELRFRNRINTRFRRYHPNQRFASARSRSVLSLQKY